MNTFERLRAWSDWMEVTGKRPKTLRQYRYWLIRFAADTLTDPWDATEDDFTGYVAAMSAQGSSRRSALQAFRSYWDWAAPRAGRNPAARLHIRRQAAQTAPYLSPTEARALVVAAFRRNPRRGWAILLVLSTGIRVGSLVGAREQDVRDGKLYLREAKGGRSYEVQLSPEAQRAVKALAADGFETLVGVGAEQFRNWLRVAAADAGIDKRVWPHLLRHTFATILGQAADPETWRVAMGHSDLSNWTRYVHPDEARVREAVEGIQSRLMARKASERERAPGTAGQTPDEFRRAQQADPSRPAFVEALSVEELQGRLTPAMLDVLILMSQRLTNDEIAFERDCSAQAVKQLATAIFARLGVKRRAEAAVLGQVLLRNEASA